jgi:high-affinity iron transporter
MSKTKFANHASKSIKAATRALRLAALVVSLLLAGTAPAFANPSDEDVQTAWRLLDYVAVDYAGAVADGKVKSAQEYAEMTEFAGAVETKLTALPPAAQKAGLLSEAKAFRGMVTQKAAADARRAPAGGLSRPART